MAVFFFCRLPSATKEELEALDDPCAICWEMMTSAKKLPCSHMFHTCVHHVFAVMVVCECLIVNCFPSIFSSCLRSWLEQDATCPTCRQSIGETPLQATPPPNPPPQANARPARPPGRRQRRQQRNFFHFDGLYFMSCEVWKICFVFDHTVSVCFCG